MSEAVAIAVSTARPAAEAIPRDCEMSGSNVVFHDAVQLIYADARRRVEEALKTNEAGEPYRLLTYALETAYPESINGQRADTATPASSGQASSP